MSIEPIQHQRNATGKKRKQNNPSSTSMPDTSLSRPDRVQAGEITIKHCLSNDMLADHFTKQPTSPRKSNLETQVRNSRNTGRYKRRTYAWACWDPPHLKSKTDFKPGSPSPQECVGTLTDNGHRKTKPRPRPCTRNRWLLRWKQEQDPACCAAGNVQMGSDCVLT
jgi:hypothetical protein